MTASHTKHHNLVGWMICLLAAIFYLYEYSLRIMPTVMTNSLMATYRTDATRLGNLTAFYYYAYAPMQLFVGIFLDRHSIRKLITFACFICGLGSYLFACSHFLALAEFGRLLVGLGSAFAFVAVLKLATVWLPPNRFAMIVGLTTALGNLGGITGVALLSILVAKFGWQITTYGAAIFGFLLAILLYLVIRDRPAILDEPQHNFPPPDEMHLTTMLVGMRTVMKNPTVWIVGLICCILYMPSTTFAELWGLPFMEHVYHLSKAQAAYCVSLMLCGFGCSAPLAGFLSDHLEKRKPLLLGSSCLTLVTSSFIVFFPHPMSLYALYVALFSFGFCYGGQILGFAVACDVSPKSLSGTAVATVNMLTMLSGIVFQPLVGYILDSHWQGASAGGIRLYSPHAYQLGLSCIPIAMAVGVFLCLGLKETCSTNLPSHPKPAGKACRR